MAKNLMIRHGMTRLQAMCRTHCRVILSTEAYDYTPNILHTNTTTSGKLPHFIPTNHTSIHKTAQVR